MIFYRICQVKLCPKMWLLKSYEHWFVNKFAKLIINAFKFLIWNRFRDKLTVTLSYPYRWVQSPITLYAEKPCGCYSSDDNTAWIHRTDLQQTCSSDVHQSEKSHQNCSTHQWFTNKHHSVLLVKRYFKMLDLLYRVCSAEPWIWPSPLIRRCSPGLAAYRCLNLTTWPQPWAMWGPWSNRGMQTIPTAKNRLATDTVTTLGCMVLQILFKRSVAAPPQSNVK